MGTKQPRILMCPPDYYGIEYEINPWMSVARAADTPLAARNRRSVADYAKASARA